MIDVYVYRLNTHGRANPSRTIDAYVNGYKTRIKKFGAIRTSQSTMRSFSNWHHNYTKSEDKKKKRLDKFMQDST